jgi:hypothetical protein
MQVYNDQGPTVVCGSVNAKNGFWEYGGALHPALRAESQVGRHKSGRCIILDRPRSATTSAMA